MPRYHVGSDCLVCTAALCPPTIVAVNCSTTLPSQTHCPITVPVPAPARIASALISWPCITTVPSRGCVTANDRTESGAPSELEDCTCNGCVVRGPGPTDGSVLPAVEVPSAFTTSTARNPRLAVRPTLIKAV